MLNRGILRIMISLVCLLPCTFAKAEEKLSGLPPALQKVGIVEKLGSKLPLDLLFRDETGAKVPLQKYFTGKKPVILALVYYRCPSLCNLTMNGMLDVFKASPWVPGTQFDVINVSIDPKEDEKIASAKKRTYIENLGKPGAEKGWHFLTGDQASIQALADAVGFKFEYDKAMGEYAHAAAIQVVTPGGVLSRYYFGVRFPERDLRLSLLEASDGKVGTVIERFMLFCYRYDPAFRGYTLVASRIMQAGGALMALLMGGLLAGFWLRERKRTAGMGRTHA